MDGKYVFLLDGLSKTWTSQNLIKLHDPSDGTEKNFKKKEQMQCFGPTYCDWSSQNQQKIFQWKSISLLEVGAEQCYPM